MNIKMSLYRIWHFIVDLHWSYSEVIRHTNYIIIIRVFICHRDKLHFQLHLTSKINSRLYLRSFWYSRFNNLLLQRQQKLFSRAALIKALYILTRVMHSKAPTKTKNIIFRCSAVLVRKFSQKNCISSNGIIIIRQIFCVWSTNCRLFDQNKEVAIAENDGNFSFKWFVLSRGVW